jgi:hypothetical protein
LFGERSAVDGARSAAAVDDDTLPMDALLRSDLDARGEGNKVGRGIRARAGGAALPSSSGLVHAVLVLSLRTSAATGSMASSYDAVLILPLFPSAAAESTTASSPEATAVAGAAAGSIPLSSKELLVVKGLEGFDGATHPGCTTCRYYAVIRR